MGKRKTKKCKHCTKLSVLRGVCRTCYNAARREILRGKTTERKLVKAGHLLPVASQEDVGRQPRGLGAKLRKERTK